MARQITIEEAEAAYAKLKAMDAAAFHERRHGRSGLFCHQGAEECQAMVQAVWDAGYGFEDGKVAPLREYA